MNLDFLREEIEKRRDDLAVRERAYGLLSKEMIGVAPLRALPAPPCDTPRREGKPKRETIPQITVGPGVPKLKRGETRTCTKCGKAKGSTGFARGSLMCRYCESGAATPKPGGKRRGRPPKTAQSPVEDIRHASALGKLPPSRFRACVSCGKKYQLTAFPDRASSVCKYCIDAARPRE